MNAEQKKTLRAYVSTVIWNISAAEVTAHCGFDSADEDEIDKVLTKYIIAAERALADANPTPEVS
jgi:hypothetical protein